MFFPPIATGTSVDISCPVLVFATIFDPLPMPSSRYFFSYAFEEESFESDAVVNTAFVVLVFVDDDAAPDSLHVIAIMHRGAVGDFFATKFIVGLLMALNAVGNSIALTMVVIGSNTK